MKRAQAIFSVFFIFVILSVIVLFFFQNPLNSFLQSVTLPIQQWTYATVSQPTPQAMTAQQLQEENSALRSQLAKVQEMQRDNKALHDQFRRSNPAPKSLLPAHVVGLHDDSLLIDKGERDGIEVGNVVVVKDNLVGKVARVTPHIAVVTIISNPTTSFTAKAAKSGAIGVIKAQGGDSIILDNVVLSDKLEKNDTVITKGDLDGKGNGYPPNLIVGKISLVNKKASDLFQSAKIQSLLKFDTLQVVFVMPK